MFQLSGDEFTIKAGNHTIKGVVREDGGFTLFGNGYRFQEFAFGGGKFNPSFPGGLPPTGSGGADIGMTVKPDGHIECPDE